MDTTIIGITRKGYRYKIELCNWQLIIKIHKTKWVLWIDDSEISCGVMQVGGLITNEKLNKFLKFVHKQEFIEIIEKAFKLIKIEEETQCAFLVISNNNDSNNNNEVNKILNKICTTSTKYRKNPNSGNPIKVWIY